jgi:hypothetical protein
VAAWTRLSVGAGLKAGNSSFLEQLQSVDYCSFLMMIEIIISIIIDLTHEQGLTLLPTSNSESAPVKASDLPF